MYVVIFPTTPAPPILLMKKLVGLLYPSLVPGSQLAQ